MVEVQFSRLQQKKTLLSQNRQGPATAPDLQPPAVFWRGALRDPHPSDSHGL